MSEKYLLSICFRNNLNDDIFSEPFGLFNSFIDAETFADNKIDELRKELVMDFNGNYDIIDEYFEFDFCIKKIKYLDI